MKITYRPEIDGLRAIAVLAVIIYHLKIDKVLEGGYLGVDVFFVISGFLISSIILKELSRTGSFSFSNFYKRRIRRLMPVFFVVLFASILAAWFILLPSQFSSFAKSGLASIFFFSNHYWFITSLEYEAQSSLLEPLLHTWTLSVEEQFYIVFPGLIVLLFIYFKKYIFSAILILTLVSLFFAESYMSTSESFCFYLLPARFWELSAGAILAILNFKAIIFNRDQFVLKNLSSIFLLILVPCFLFFDHETKHPGLMTIIPVLATMGILFFAHKDDIATKLLSSKPFVFIGLLSYSLYLWHYPIFAFGRNLYFEHSIIDFSVWIGLTFFLSFLSYKFIEQPFRNKTIVKSKKFIFAIITLLIVSTTSLFLIIDNEGFPQRFNNLTELYFGNEVDNRVLKNKKDEYYNKVNTEADFKTGNSNVLFIGDSHAKDLYLSFYLNKDVYPKYSFYKTGTIKLKDKSKKGLMDNELIKSADIVVFCYRFINKIEKLENLNQFITRLKKEDKRVIIALNNAEFVSYGRDEVFDNHVKKFDSNSNILDHDQICNYFYESRKVSVDVVNDSILNFVKKMDVEYIDRYSLVCNDESKSCKGITSSGVKTFADGNHFSLAGAKYFGNELRKRDCLVKTNFVSKEFKASTINPDFDIGGIKAAQKEKYKEIYEDKSEMKQKLKNKDLSPEERKELRKQERLRLKKKRKVLKDKVKIEEENK